MRNIQKVIATGISVAMTATMCVAVPATAAFADEAANTSVEGEEASDLIDIAEVIKSNYAAGPCLYMGEPATPCDSIAQKYVNLDTPRALKKGEDFTVTYENNDKVGTATATLKGLESAGFTGEKTFTFDIIDFTISVTYTNEAGETKTVASLDHDAVVSLMKSSEDNTTSLCYQHGTGANATAYYVPAKSYLTYDSIMRAVGITGWKHATGIGADNFKGTAISAEINDEGMFFPAQTTSDTTFNAEGAYHVPCIITTQYASETITTTASAAAKAASKKDMQKAVKLFSGALMSDYTSSDPKVVDDALTGKRLATNVVTFAIDSYTPLKANTITAKASKSTVKNNKKQTVQIKTSKAKGTVSYSVSSAPSKKAVKVSKKGVVTIAKGAKTGKYVIAVKAAGNKDYKAKTVKVTIKVTK